MPTAVEYAVQLAEIIVVSENAIQSLSDRIGHLFQFPSPFGPFQAKPAVDAHAVAHSAVAGGGGGAGSGAAFAAAAAPHDLLPAPLPLHLPATGTASPTFLTGFASFHTMGSDAWQVVSPDPR